MIKVKYSYSYAFDEEETVTVKEYETVQELLNDALGYGYAAGLNDAGVIAEVIDE